MRNENNSTIVNSQAIAALEESAANWNIAEFERRAAAGESFVWGGGSWEAPLIRGGNTTLDG